MKKLLFTIIAASTMILCSCHKNPAEQFEGAYNLTCNGTVTITVPVVGAQSQPIEQTGSMTIALNGDEGDVAISGDIFNTTGHVDENGVLTLADEIYTTSISGVEAKLNVKHEKIYLGENGTLTWSSNLGGSAEAMGVELPVAATITNTATRK